MGPATSGGADGVDQERTPAMLTNSLGHEAAEDGGRRLATRRWPESARFGIRAFLAGILSATVAGLGPTPAQADERDLGIVNPAWLGSTTILAAAELEEQRGGAVDSAPEVDLRHGSEIAVILWDELNGRHNVIPAGGEAVSVVGVR